MLAASGNRERLWPQNDDKEAMKKNSGPGALILVRALVQSVYLKLRYPSTEEGRTTCLRSQISHERTGMLL